MTERRFEIIIHQNGIISHIQAQKIGEFIYLCIFAFRTVTMKKRTLQDRLLAWPRFSFTLIWTGLIFLACLIDPSPMVEDLPPMFGIDKVAHFVLYFVLIGLFLWEYNARRWKGNKKDAKKLFWFSLLISCILGAVVEYLQSLTAYRGMDEMDLVADIVGALFAYLFYCIQLLKPQDNNEEN